MNSLFNLPLIFFILLNITFINCSLKIPIINRTDRCFIEEIIEKGELLIKYHLDGFDKDTSEEEKDLIARNLRVFVYKNDNKKVPIKLFDIEEKKGKLVLSTDKTTEVKICVRFEIGYRYKFDNFKQRGLFLGIKFSNNFNKINIDDALQKDSVKNFDEKLNTIKNFINPSLNSQQKEIDQEEETAEDIIFCSKLYYNLAIIQIIAIVIIAIYQVFNFRKFLASNKII